jgi:hypothetical protein
MLMPARYLFVACLLWLTLSISAQEIDATNDTVTPPASSLLDMLDEITTPTTEPFDLRKQKVYETFGGFHLINGQSVETDAKNVMAFIISHRFGRLNGGFYEFFGLDNASIRFAFHYGITDDLNIGFARSNYNKTIDFYAKYRVLQQRERGIPVSITLYGDMAMNTLKWRNPNRDNYFSSRLSFTSQVLVARKFNDWLSLQLMPTVVHYNLVPTEADKNTLFLMGVGGKVKVTKRMALLAEYYARIGDNPDNGFRDAFAFGIDLVTGGHVFQFQFTNAQAMFDSGFMRETIGNFWKGDIHFGFNISRTFGVGKGKKGSKSSKKDKGYS